VFDDANWTTDSKSGQRGFLDDAGSPGAEKAGVMYDHTAANVDAVMPVSDAQRLEVCAQCRLGTAGRAFAPQSVPTAATAI
jgi:hypothetical protein